MRWDHFNIILKEFRYRTGWLLYAIWAAPLFCYWLPGCSEPVLSGKVPVSAELHDYHVHILSPADEKLEELLDH